MVYIDWQLEWIANFFMLFAILQLKHYFIRKFSLRFFLADIALALVFGYIGLFFDELFVLFFIGAILIFNWCVKKYRANMQNSISLIMAANIELVLFSLGTYSARILFFIAYNQWRLTLLETYQEYFIPISLVINLLYLLIVILVFEHFRYQTIKLWLQIEKYHLGKRVLVL